MRRFKARFWHQLGLMQRFLGLRTGQRHYFEQAEGAFTRALALVVDFREARYERGLLYWRELGFPTRAIQDFDAVLELEPDYTDAIFMRAMAHQALGDYWSAADDLQMFLTVSPYSRWADNAFSQLNNLSKIIDDLPRPIPRQVR